MILMASAIVTTASMADVETSLEKTSNFVSENMKHIKNSDPFPFFNQYDTNNPVMEKSDKCYEDISVNTGSV